MSSMASTPLQLSDFRVYKLWNNDQMNQAIQDVVSGLLTIKEAATMHRIPRTTLIDRIKGKKKRQ